MPRTNRTEGDTPPAEPDESLDAPPAPPREAQVEPAAGRGPAPPHVTLADPVPPTGPNLEARAEALRERYGPHGLTVMIEAPFVLVGDEGDAALRGHAEHIVRWAVRRLEQDFFDAPPRDIVEVWLLGDDASYRAHARAVFDDEPDTPYGYFSSTHRVLVMNIATGGGTLVHELVHPYIESDFPRCPSWFDEGLASLYEQCADHEGHIWGLPNWRLPGLQQAIEAGTLPSFVTLLSTTRHEFYEEDPGSHYAQARYLCFYLQQEDRLRDFYRDFRRDAAKDPSGLATLRAHVGEDLSAFQRTWERWVLTLRYG